MLVGSWVWRIECDDLSFSQGRLSEWGRRRILVQMKCEEPSKWKYFFSLSLLPPPRPLCFKCWKLRKAVSASECFDIIENGKNNVCNSVFLSSRFCLFNSSSFIVSSFEKMLEIEFSLIFKYLSLCFFISNSSSSVLRETRNLHLWFRLHKVEKLSRAKKQAKQRRKIIPNKRIKF